MHSKFIKYGVIEAKFKTGLATSKVLKSGEPKLQVINKNNDETPGVSKIQLNFQLWLTGNWMTLNIPIAVKDTEYVAHD